jgi:Fe-S cluster biosynthesis and repair protein YggX
MYDTGSQLLRLKTQASYPIEIQQLQFKSVHKAASLQWKHRQLMIPGPACV